VAFLPIEVNLDVGHGGENIKDALPDKTKPVVVDMVVKHSDERPDKEAAELVKNGLGGAKLPEFLARKNLDREGADDNPLEKLNDADGGHGNQVGLVIAHKVI